VEVGWAIEGDLVQGLVICIQNTLDLVALWLVDVAGEGEAVRDDILRQLPSKAVHWVHLISIVVRQNIEDG